MVIDPSTPLGKCRLRTADYGDLPLLPDEVYLTTLAENNDNVQRSSMICATYILGMFAQGCHQKMSFLEIWSGEKYKQYESYLTKIAKDPTFNGSSPIPYTGASSTTTKNPLIQFVEDWENSYQKPTQSEDLNNIAAGNNV